MRTPTQEQAVKVLNGETATSLDWLRSLLTELDETNWPKTTADAEAAWTALNVSRSLLRSLESLARELG